MCSLGIKGWGSKTRPWGEFREYGFEFVVFGMSDCSGFRCHVLFLGASGRVGVPS